MLTCRYVVNMLALDDVNASTKLCFKLNIIFSSSTSEFINKDDYQEEVLTLRDTKRLLATCSFFGNSGID